MACELRELQLTEYEVLCKFAEFCDTHNITYGLSGGTLLGAVRHNGFIPWDDDIDVHMEMHEFKRFVRIIRKHPIPGIHFSWITTDPEHPYWFARLRKCGTFMPQDKYASLDMHNGIWMDIIVYCGAPKSERLLKLQQKLYFVFVTATRMSLFKHIDARNEESFQYNAKYRFIQNLSNKNRIRLAKLFFALYSALGSRHSEYITYTDWVQHPKEKLPRSFELPVCKHVFEDREFSIPVNYDASLTKQYGDYMTPVEFPCHADLSHVEV
ncbi:MAG: LicD family protein [Clostridia bacterium]|nr:LicD family protein [Clostridia bacterium]